jgi:hypothetical protein
MTYGLGVPDIVLKEDNTVAQVTDPGSASVGTPRLTGIGFADGMNKLGFETVDIGPLPIRKYVVFIGDLPVAFLDAGPDAPHAATWEIPGSQFHNAGTFVFSIVAVDKIGTCSKRAVFELETGRGRVFPKELDPTVYLPSTLRILTKSMPAATYGVPYEFTVAVSGNYVTNETPATIRFSAPGLEPGSEILGDQDPAKSAQGIFNGTFTKLGKYLVTFMVSDIAGETTGDAVSKTFALEVKVDYAELEPPIWIHTLANELELSDLVFTRTYGIVPSEDGDPPFAFSSDDLPQGLSLDPVNGKITGSLEKNSNLYGNFKFTHAFHVTIEDANGVSKTRPVILFVWPNTDFSDLDPPVPSVQGVQDLYDLGTNFDAGELLSLTPYQSPDASYYLAYGNQSTPADTSTLNTGSYGDVGGTAGGVERVFYPNATMFAGTYSQVPLDNTNLREMWVVTGRSGSVIQRFDGQKRAMALTLPTRYFSCGIQEAQVFALESPTDTTGTPLTGKITIDPSGAHARYRNILVPVGFNFDALCYGIRLWVSCINLSGNYFVFWAPVTVWVEG